MTAIRTGVLLVIIAGFTLAFFTLPTLQQPAFSLPGYPSVNDPGDPLLETAFVSGDLTREVHSATAVELNNGDIRLFW